MTRPFWPQAADTGPLASRAFRRLLVGHGTAFAGAMLTQVAVPVQVYAITGSTLAVGMVGFAGLVPVLIFGLYGGAIADSMDRRMVYIGASAGTWVGTLILLLQALLDLGSVLLILVLVFVQASFAAIAGAARGAIVPRLVPAASVPAANTLVFTVMNAGMVLGPLAAGVLVGLKHGFVWAYAVDAALFTAALMALAGLPALPASGRRTGSHTGAVLEGLRYIGRNPVLLMSFGVDILAMVIALPRALFPEVAAHRFHGGVGLLYAAIPVGAVVAGALSGWIGAVRRQGTALTTAVVVYGLAVAAAGLARPLALAVVLLAVAGAADLVSSVFRQTILQSFAPDLMRGRIQGVFIAVVVGGPRLGDLRAGASANALGVTSSWVGGGLACAILVVVAAFAVPAFAQYRRPPRPGRARRVSQPN